MKRTVLLAGDPGTGKSTQINTLPGKVLVYAFDPNVRRAIKRDDIEIVEFLPQWGDIDLRLSTLKGERDSGDKGAKNKAGPLLYLEWKKDLEARIDAGMITKDLLTGKSSDEEKIEEKVLHEVDWLVIDSLAHFSEAVMQRTLHVQDRPGGIEQLGDYRITGKNIASVFQQLASPALKPNLLVTSHIKGGSEGEQKFVLHTFGSAKFDMPTIFDEIWETKINSDDKRIVQTKANFRSLQCLRSTVTGLAKDEDVTLNWKKPLEGQGIASLFERSK